MAGRGRTPKDARRNKSDVPTRGEWKPAQGIGWQYGAMPTPPEGLKPASVAAWKTWFSAWYAAHWTPDDLPGLRKCVELYDQVERGEYQRAAELRLWLDTWGISPKGQQDRRWVRPLGVGPAVRDDERPEPAATPYGHLRAVK